MSWFKRKLKSPEHADLGRAEVHIVANDSRSYEVSFVGHYRQNGSRVFTYTSQYLFEIWQERCGKTGMVDCCNGIYIPLCNVVSISVKHVPMTVVKPIS